MADPRGLLKVKAGGADYALWLGMSGLADLQASRGQDVLQQLDAPKDAGEGWVPDMGIIVDLLLASLARYHPDADRFVVDEIFSDNPGVVMLLLTAAFPDAKAAPGNVKRPKRVASK